MPIGPNWGLHLLNMSQKISMPNSAPIYFMLLAVWILPLLKLFQETHKVRFFYEFGWLTSLRLWVLSQAEKTIFSVFAFGKDCRFQKMKNVFFEIDHERKEKISTIISAKSLNKSSPFLLVTTHRFYRIFMKRKLNVYVPWPYGEKSIFSIVAWSTTVIS